MKLLNVIYARIKNRWRWRDDKMRMTENAVAIVTRKSGEVEVYHARNIVTDEGDKYYAQRGAAETPTNTFNTIELGTAGNAPAKTSTRADMTTKVAGSQELVDTGYPKTNDTGDPDNTGDGVDVVTWTFSYEKGDLSASNIDRAIITVASPGVSAVLLTYFTFAAAFSMTADDTLKVIVNHTFNGV